MKSIPVSVLRKAIALRAKLHEIPEPSGNEVRTAETIAAFLRENTAFDVRDMGGWLLAEHREGDGLRAIAFRAELDAIADPGGGARHGCGHDGHCATLCALALLIDGARVGANVFLVFQPAEETGEGAKRVLADWPGARELHRIYALHNLPGWPAGTILARPGCFACASRGFIVEITGRPAHAAYPEDGANPVGLLCRLALGLPEMISEILAGDGRLLMHTVVGLNAGGERFGLSAAEGRLCLTLRGDREADIDALAGRIRDFALAGCRAGGMTARFETREAFPDTANPPEVVEEALRAWERAGLSARVLDRPMRWSEDFGRFLREAPGMYFGVGSGEGCPGLHTEGYCFDDAIIEPAAQALYALI